MGAEWVRLKENDAENSLIHRLKSFKGFLRDALVMLSESEWRSCPCVIIESDSKVVVSWVLQLERRP
ncbi:hypothetical protein V6N11_012963, partial [Hibiscus sabdariffa]